MCFLVTLQFIACTYRLVSVNHVFTNTVHAHSHTLDISVQVELLVRAHDCYTLGCSVDGISEVLLVVRQWVPNLVSLKLFSFMVSVNALL